MKSKNIFRTLLTCAFFLGVLTMNAQTKVYVHKADGTAAEYNIADIDSISFTPPAGAVDYTMIKLNEVSGVGDDPEKFYELINTGSVPVNLEGCQLFYNANGSTGGNLPTGDGTLTWTGKSTHVIQPGGLLLLLGRYNASSNPGGEFTTGLTPERILIITFKDPKGTVIDKCIRSKDTEEYGRGREESFSRIPDGNGPFYFTTPTPGVMNGGDATGLVLLPGASDIPVDYTKLKINEVNGVDKWFEIYNAGEVDINLAGVTSHYSNSEPVSYNPTVNWTGTAAQTVPAKGFFSTKGITLGTGLSANNGNVRLQLRDPEGTVLDTYEKLKDINTGYDAIKNKSHARIPDGTGIWYYTTDEAGTSGATNGTSTAGYTKIGEEDGATDFTDLVLNEIDGNSKSIELFNKGTKAIPLIGVTLWKNETTSAWWTGSAASGSIAPDSYVLIYQTGQNPNESDAPGFVGANGISAGQTLKFELRDPDGNSIGVFQRGGPVWSQSISSVAPNSFQRIPNGTGDWKQADPTNGEANAESGTDIPND